MYLLLHKPAGVLTATEDKRQPTVLDLPPETYRRIAILPRWDGWTRTRRACFC